MGRINSLAVMDIKMKVLITGASGFVGSHVLEYLLEKTKWDFVCICSWEHKGCPTNVPKNDRVKVITHDLTAPITPKLYKQIGEIDYILNIASESHVDRSIEEPREFILNNIKLAITMLEAARVIKPKLFLQFSTDEVYGSVDDGYNSMEWDAIIPSNPYAASKASQEALAIAYWRTYKVPVVITNTMNVFGERQDKEKFIPLCIDKILKGEKISIHSYPDKKRAGSRFYIHGKNVADAILFILNTVNDSIFADNKPLRINIVGEKEIDNLTLALAIGKIVEKCVNYELVDFHSSRPGHDTRYALDGSLLERIGWKPPYTFDERLDQVVKSYL